MAISKTSCAALVKSIIALIFAVWSLVFPAKGESITPDLTYNSLETREPKMEERVLELQCATVSHHQTYGPDYWPKDRLGMECMVLVITK